MPSSSDLPAKRESERMNPLALDDFMPYKLAVVAEAVSRCTANVYAKAFNLSRDEWRVLAALGQTETLNTKATQLRTTLDKVQASRAIAKLERKALLVRHADTADRRNHVLTLTSHGRHVYEDIVPRVRALEHELLNALPKRSQEALELALNKLLKQAQQLSAGFDDAGRKR